ncbi:MAG: adenylate/guanylate cyclase domain-containing protein [Desulforhopalus sp.]
MSKILVIDGQGDVYEMCRSLLPDLGHEVAGVTNGSEALTLATQQCFDLVIVDSGDTLKDNLANLHQIRLSAPLIAGILVIADAGVDMVLEAVNNGFSRVCRKPLFGADLVEAVVETTKITLLREDVTRMKTLLPLYELGQKFIAVKTEQGVYEEMVEAISRELGVPSVSIMMFDEIARSLKIVAQRGLEAKFVDNLEVRPGEKISGRVFTTRKPIILNRDSKQHNPYYHLMERDELSAAISFPIVRREKVVGVLNISETREGIAFSEGDIEMLSIITDQAMMALENVRSIREREENSRIRALLEQYVSPEVSLMLLEASQDLLNVGSVEELTVLFADIRNFTLLVQHLEPSQIREFLNAYFDFFSSIVFSAHGMLDKFMGDGALVIFGAPVRIATPDLDAVTAAQEIMTGFERLRAKWIVRKKVFRQVGLGIGISRGPMFLGNVGSAKRLDYTVIGADVNIAQRLASETEPGRILITDKVHRRLGGKFTVSAEQSMQLRGIEEPVNVYSVAFKDVRDGKQQQD